MITPKRTLAVACTLALALPATARASVQVGGPFVGSTGFYDYSPSSIRDANTETVWWCGDTASHQTDSILEEQYSLAGWTVAVPERQVLAEGPAGSWDSMFTCNPSVVEGSFANPFGDGRNYTYAMYYVGTTSGSDNSIGAAFSNDGGTWRKYPTPVLRFTDTGHGYYGYGQPNAAIVNGQVELLFEDSDASPQSGPVRSHAAFPARPQAQHVLGRAVAAALTTHWYTVSSDGAHFGPPVPIASSGLPDPTPSWGGAAFDPQDGRWYALFNGPFRPAATTGSVAERGQVGVTLYATSSLASGPWIELDTIDTVVTGSEANFIAGMVRDPGGNLSPAFLPGIKIDLSQSWPRPAYNTFGPQLGASGAFNNWQIGWALWNPGAPYRALQRVDYSGGHHEVTTGWWDTSVYHLENMNLGKLAEAPTGTATVPVYLCKAAATDYVDTLHADCTGWYQAGLLGYISPAPGTGLIPIYSCISPAGHFVSPDPACEGQSTDTLEPGGLLGYAQP
jgi:hypothetical protein